MALPLLAMLGLGVGYKGLSDNFNRSQQQRQLDEMMGMAGMQPSPLFQGQGPLMQGAPGMSQGTGAYSNDPLERLQAMQSMVNMPGAMTPQGATQLKLLQSHADSLNQRSLANTMAPLLPQSLQSMASAYPEKSADFIFKQAGAEAKTGPFQGSGVQATALNLYHTLSRKDNLTDDEKSAFDLAKWQLQQPRQQYDNASGQMVTIQPPPLPGTTKGTYKAEAPGKAPGTVDKQIRLTKGSPRYIEAQQEVQTYQRATDNIRRMRKLIKSHGTEAYGPVSAQMATLYGQITADIAALRDMGVLQAGELENIQGQIQDPSKVKSIFASRDTMMSGYTELEQLFNTKLKDSRKIYEPMGIEFKDEPKPQSGYLTYDPVTGEIN